MSLDPEFAPDPQLPETQLEKSFRLFGAGTIINHTEGLSVQEYFSLVVLKTNKLPSLEISISAATSKEQAVLNKDKPLNLRLSIGSEELYAAGLTEEIEEGNEITEVLKTGAFDEIDKLRIRVKTPEGEFIAKPDRKRLLDGMCDFITFYPSYIGEEKWEEPENQAELEAALLRLPDHSQYLQSLEGVFFVREKPEIPDTFRNF